jgi:hypothetical protein
MFLRRREDEEDVGIEHAQYLAVPEISRVNLLLRCGENSQCGQEHQEFLHLQCFY